MTTRVRGERGMVGKLIVVWLFLLLVFGVAVIDAGSIMLTKFRLAETATLAASGSAAALNRGQSPTVVCELAADIVAEEEPDARPVRHDWCVADSSEGSVTIALHKTASTLLAGRLPFTEDFANVSVQESVGRSSL